MTASTLNATHDPIPRSWVDAATLTPRVKLSRLLAADQETHRATMDATLSGIDAVELRLLVWIGGFANFFAAVHHASKVRRLFRPDMPLLPNYKLVPIGCNGRVDNVPVSGAGVQRPWGQSRGAAHDAPRFAPAQQLENEIERGTCIGTPSRQGTPGSVGDAWQHVFGFPPRRLRREGRAVRARPHLPAKLQAAERPGWRHLLEGLRGRSNATSRRQHVGLHVREPPCLTPDRAGRLCVAPASTDPGLCAGGNAAVVSLHRRSPDSQLTTNSIAWLVQS